MDERLWRRMRAEIARKNGVSPRRVEREIKRLIRQTWKDGGEGRRMLEQAGGGRMPCPRELVEYVGGKAMREEGK